MKKLIIFALLISMTVFFASCSKKDAPVSSENTLSTLSAGEIFKVGGTGDFTVKKAHTTDVIYSSLRSGTFVECEKEENTYIDIVMRFKNKKQAVNLSEIISASALGKKSGKKYSDFLCLFENEQGSGLSASVEIAPLSETTVHIAVEVPEDSEDDIYTVEILACDDKFEFDYKLSEFVHNMETVYEGQSLSNSRTKAKLDSCNYSTYLYDKAPAVCDAPDGTVYLVTRFKVMNKSFESRDLNSIISSHIRYDDKVFETNYLMSDKEDEGYSSADVMQGLSEAYVISFCAVPLEYAQKDAVVVFAIDHNEFYTKIFGTDVFEERKIDFGKIETTAPVVQEDPVSEKENEPEQETQSTEENIHEDVTPSDVLPTPDETLAENSSDTVSQPPEENTPPSAE